MSILSCDYKTQILACLTEGMSIRSTERITGVHRDTIMRLGTRVGRGCAEFGSTKYPKDGLSMPSCAGRREDATRG